MLPDPTRLRGLTAPCSYSRLLFSNQRPILNFIETPERVMNTGTEAAIYHRSCTHNLSSREINAWKKNSSWIFLQALILQLLKLCVQLQWSITSSLFLQFKWKPVNSPTSKLAHNKLAHTEDNSPTWYQNKCVLMYLWYLVHLISRTAAGNQA